MSAADSASPFGRIFRLRAPYSQKLADPEIWNESCKLSTENSAR